MRKMLVAIVVVALVAAAANAAITYTATYLGTAPVQDGGATVDTWNLTFRSDGAPIAGGAFDLIEPGYQFGWPANPPHRPVSCQRIHRRGTTPNTCRWYRRTATSI